MLLCFALEALSGGYFAFRAAGIICYRAPRSYLLHTLLICP